MEDHMAEPTLNRLAIGTKVTVPGIGRLWGLIVDYIDYHDHTRYVVAFPRGTEMVFSEKNLIVLKR